MPAMRLAPILFSLCCCAPLAMAGDARPAAATEALDLQGLLDLALAHDGRVLAAHARLDAYRAQYDEARWAWFPHIKIKGLFGGPVGQRELDCPDDPNCVRLKHRSATNLGNLSEQVSFAVGGQVEATVPLYTFGKISGAKHAARAGVRASVAGIAKERQDVALELRRAWYGWLLACATVRVLENGDKKLSKVEEKLVQMLDEFNENVTQQDLFKLRYKSSEVRKMLADARKGKEMALAALRFLTGIEDLGTGRPLAEVELERTDHKAVSREDYLAQARRQRPELRALKAIRDAAAAKVDMKQATFYPDFFLLGRFEGSYSPAHQHISNSLLNRGLTYYTGGVSLGFQLTLDIPQKMAQLEQAEADLRRAEIQLAQADEALVLDIDRRLAQLKAAEQYHQILRKGARAAKAWRRANEMSYGVGMANTRDMLESLTAWATSRIEKQKANYDWLVARDQLDLAVGRDLGRVQP